MKKRTPWMVMIAGPNGAGKSTFYDLVIKKDPLMKNAPFVNLDNMIKYDPNILEIVNLFKNKKSINPHLVEPNYLKETEAEENLRG